MSQPETKHEQGLNLAEKLAWLRLARTENVGPITFFNFIDYYGTAEKSLAAIPELARRGGRKKPLRIPPLSDVEKEYEAIRKLGGDIIAACEEDYPLALSALEGAPPILSVLGNTGLMKRPCLAIVGSRNASLNGRKFTENLAKDLGEAGQVIVSGMARGIDTAAHVGALESGTISVVAGGINVVYPQENQKLYDEIKEKGLIVAENPFGQKPFARSFPQRNRIVSGLSAGVLVVEAGMRSGSLITARLAGEQGRDVYAVPGHPMDPRAQGTNALIRDGAVLIRHAEDLLSDLQNFSGRLLKDSGISRYTPQTPLAESINIEEEPPEDARRMIMDSLSYTPVGVDELLRACQLTVPVVQSILLELEIAGSVQRLPGNRVSLIKEE